MLDILVGKVVLITGGASGIGQSLCLSFGKRGAQIAFSDINETGIDETESLCSQAGIINKSFVSDAASETDNKQLIANVISTYGRLDVLIANAGIGGRYSIEEIDVDLFRSIVNVNFLGAVYITKYALPHLLQTKGSVIGISSVVGYCNMPNYSPYAASKSAVQSFYKVLRMETHKRLHVMVVCPGITNTNLMKRAMDSIGGLGKVKMMQPEEVSEAIYHAYRRKRQQLILTWKGRLLVWLNRMLPSLTERMIKAFFAHIEKRKRSSTSK